MAGESVSDDVCHGLSLPVFSLIVRVHLVWKANPPVGPANSAEIGGIMSDQGSDHNDSGIHPGANFDDNGTHHGSNYGPGVDGGAESDTYDDAVASSYDDAIGDTVRDDDRDALDDLRDIVDGERRLGYSRRDADSDPDATADAIERLERAVDRLEKAVERIENASSE